MITNFGPVMNDMLISLSLINSFSEYWSGTITLFLGNVRPIQSLSGLLVALKKKVLFIEFEN